MRSDRRLDFTVEVNLQAHFFERGRDRELEQQSYPIPEQKWREWFQSWLALLPDIPPAEAYELTLRLTDDAEIQQLNAQYRQQNQPTDVLAFAALEVDFPMAEELDCEPLYLGDIIISVETAHRQAQKQEHSISTELVWLAAHGFLHLLGWDHPDEAQLQRMLRQQERLLNGVGFTLEFE
jgi:probable rRNA maturation factor